VNINEMDDTDAEINDAATSGGGTGGTTSDGGHMPPTATSGGLPAPPGGHLAAIGRRHDRRYGDTVYDPWH